MNEHPRTDATSRDRSPDHQYVLTIDQAAELYAAAGLPRTHRAIQKYCALTKLDCHKVETEFGERYLVAPYSVERHIKYIQEVRTDATSRDQSRTDATVRPLESKDEVARTPAAHTQEQPRPDANVPGISRYVERLESENEFLRKQVEVKDGQIKEMTERARETNILIGGLQQMLTPLLGASRGPTRESEN